MRRRKISMPRPAAGEVGSSHETGWRGEPLQIWILK
jgi:hypothetical protein